MKELTKMRFQALCLVITMLTLSFSALYAQNKHHMFYP